MLVRRSPITNEIVSPHQQELRTPGPPEETALALTWVEVGVKGWGEVVDGLLVTMTVQPGVVVARGSVLGSLNAAVRISTALAVGALVFGGAFRAPSWTKPSPMLLDVPLVLLCFFGALRLLADKQSRTTLAKCGLIYLGGLAASLAVHPTANGGLQTVRLFASLIIITELSSLATASRVAFEKALVLLGIGETALVIAHHFVGHALFNNVVEAYYSPFSDDGFRHPEGSFPHWYILAAFALVVGAVAISGAMRGTLSLPWAAVGVLPAGFFSLAAVGRNAVAGAVLLAVCLVIGIFGIPSRRLVLGVALGVLLVSSVAGIWSQRDAWERRTATTATSSSTVTAMADRNQKMRQAIELWKTSPVTGVGVGNYMATLKDSPARSLDPQFLPVHNYGLFVLVEGGIVGIVCSVPLLGLLFARLRKGALLATAPILAIAPFLALDMLFVDIPVGMLLLAVALGLFAFPVSHNEDRQIKLT